MSQLSEKNSLRIHCVHLLKMKRASAASIYFPNERTTLTKVKNEFAS